MKPTAARLDPHDEQAEESAAKWINATEAAQLLSVSPRSIQRRCRAGTLPARRVQGERSEVWEVKADALKAARNERDSDGDSSTTATPNNATTTATSTISKPSVALISHDSRSINATSERDDDDDGDTKEHDSDGDTPQSVALELQRTRDELARERAERARDAEQIKFLRELTEGLQQSEAQTKAALREALKAMPKQLEGRGTQAREIAQDAPATVTPTDATSEATATVKAPQNAKGAAPLKEPRPLWRLLLGIK